MIRVVKIGGRAQENPALADILAEVWRGSDGGLCIVHGGGDEVTTLQRRLGKEPRFVGGRRYTSADELDVVRMVLSGSINKRLVRQLRQAGVPAVGLSGEDGGLLPSTLFDGGSLGRVGIPETADCGVLEAFWRASLVPVVSPLGFDRATGEGLNINGDDAAAAIAVGSGAEELFLLADVAGVLDASGIPLETIDLDGVPVLVGTGVVRAGMLAKLEATRRALLGGVRHVRIGDAAALTDASRGTVVLPSPSTV